MVIAKVKAKLTLQRHFG